MQQQYKQINQLKFNFIMIFVTKSLSKPYWSFKNNVKLILNFYISKNYIKIIIYLKFYMFYFNQFLHNHSNQFFVNLILIRF